ncbi:MAG: asparagine--tRNA ligase [Ruminococcaceae bacterium]|jgi:asparaginyl-tRNA synthetase|nr:asparagine--tRNA ligase [Oscillospiraceae bacterium]
MKHTDLCDIFSSTENYVDKDITVCGWVRTVRDSKAVGFIALNDGTSLNNLQIVIDKEGFEKADEALHLSVGSSISVSGKLVKSLNDQQPVELHPTELTVLGTCPSDYPMQKKRHTLEFLRTIPHLRGRTNTFNAMFRIRSELAKAIHDFFQGRNFTYVHTPIITGSDCEGAGEIFRVTTHEFNTPYNTEEEYYANDFFKKKAGLTVSGQLEGEALALAMGKIYTFGPTFRAEKSNTPRHAAEFWQIEPEVSFADLNDIISLATDMIKYITKAVLDACPEEIDFFEKFFEKGLKDKLNNIVNSDFAVLEYTEAIEILKKADVEFQYPVSWGLDLQTEHERYLTDKVFGRPVFVINYPKEIKSFYMKLNPDGKTVAATDLLVPGVGEIIGASQREDNYDLLLDQIKSRGMTLEDYEWYLDLRKYGSAPHSGFGLGFERMLMYITGVGNIRDTAAFPRTTGSLV